MEAAPLFVKIDKYKELTKVLASVDEKLRETSELLERLETLKEQEDAQLAAWKASLDDVRARSDELHSHLFK